MDQLETRIILHDLLVHEAKRWVGTKEIGGNNSGQLVELFQKAVDGKAVKEAWCMAFVQFSIINSLQYFYIANKENPNTVSKALFSSEHCMTVWNKTPVAQRRLKPEAGLIAIWNHQGTTNGHTEICTSEIYDSVYFDTVGGNTGSGSGVVREGDGVWARKRNIHGEGTMKLVGFIDPFSVV
jgi:hypothetical protein